MPGDSRVCAVVGRAALWGLAHGRPWSSHRAPGRTPPRNRCGLRTCRFRPASTTRARRRGRNQRNRVAGHLSAARRSVWSPADASGDRRYGSAPAAGACHYVCMAASGSIEKEARNNRFQAWGEQRVAAHLSVNERRKNASARHARERAAFFSRAEPLVSCRSPLPRMLGGSSPKAVISSGLRSHCSGWRNWLSNACFTTNSTTSRPLAVPGEIKSK